MTSVFERNTSFISLPKELHSTLASFNPEHLPDGYELHPTRAGGTTLRVQGRFVISRYDPVRESHTLLSRIASPKANYFLFAGIGLGYPAHTFRDNAAQYLGERDYARIHLFIAEPDLVVLAYTLHTVDLTPLTPFHVYCSDYAHAPSFFSQYFHIERFKGIRVLTIPALTQEERAGAERLKQTLLAAVEESYASLLTTFHFETVWARNIIRNAEQLPTAEDVSSLSGIGKGLPVVVAASGPTLTDSANDMRTLREGFVLVAVDTAYAPLMKMGITPDFVVSLDAGFYNYLDFVYERLPYPYLVADIASYPSILRTATADTFVFDTVAEGKNTAFFDAFESATGAAIGRLRSAGTIASTAIDFAVHLGCSPVMLIGHDLAYVRYETHAVHTTAYEYHLQRATKTNPVTAAFFNQTNARRVRGDGTYPPTDHAMRSQTHWYRALSTTYPNTKFVRIQGEGVALPEIANGTIADIVIPKTQETILSQANSVRSEGVVAEERVRTFFTNARAELETLIDETISAPNRFAHSSPQERRDLLRAELERAVESLPFLKSPLRYALFSIDRREGDDPDSVFHVLRDEILKSARYFRSRIAAQYGD